MNAPAKVFFVFLFMNFRMEAAFCQQAFRGSFMMSFTFSPEQTKKSDSLWWNIDQGKMALEIQDEMKKKGVSKRVLFDPADSTWTMGLEFSKVKQGTRIHAASMFKDSTEENKIRVKSSGKKRIIAGHTCHEVLTQSDTYSSVIWVTDDFNFNLCRLYKMLAHCGMMGSQVGKGDWFLWKQKKGMILEVVSRKNSSGESCTLTITQLKEGVINSSFFSFAGYKISDIPEGQHCGPVAEEK